MIQEIQTSASNASLHDRACEFIKTEMTKAFEGKTEERDLNKDEENLLRKNTIGVNAV